MTDWSKWLWFPGAKFVVLACMVVILMDVGLRVLPATSNSKMSANTAGEDLFGRLAPSSQWTAWYEGLKAAAAMEAERALQERQQALEQKAVAPAPRVEKDMQQGDVESFRVGQLTYRLWGVFKKRHPQSGSDSFGVLRGEGQTLQVRRGDVVEGYRVGTLTPRSVTFESTVDERVVTLWLFGKGPR